jgi:excisionase family DNA binding protein
MSSANKNGQSTSIARLIEEVGISPEIAMMIERAIDDMIEDRIRSRDRMMKIPEVADRLGISERSVHNLIAGGKLRPIKVLGSTRFERAAIEDFIRALARASDRRFGA